MKANLSAITTRNMALTAVFASLYLLFYSWPLFPLIGSPGQFIKAGNIIAPIIGIILGPWLGVFATTVGGVMGAFLWQAGPFGPISFLPHVAVVFFAGMLYKNRRWICRITYLLSFLAFALYPVVGPAWLAPSFLWLHVASLGFLFTPFQSKPREFMMEEENLSKLTLGVGTISLVASLFGHVIGSLMFEGVYWPSFISEISAWKSSWALLVWIYPMERILIAVFSALAGTGLVKALKVYGFKIGG